MFMFRWFIAAKNKLLMLILPSPFLRSFCLYSLLHPNSSCYIMLIHVAVTINTRLDVYVRMVCCSQTHVVVKVNSSYDVSVCMVCCIQIQVLMLILLVVTINTRLIVHISQFYCFGCFLSQSKLVFPMLPISDSIIITNCLLTKIINFIQIFRPIQRYSLG